LRTKGVKIDNTIAEIAASRGHLKTIEWLHSIKVKFSSNTMAADAACGDLPTVMYLIDSKVVCTDYVWIAATASRHDHILAYLCKSQLITLSFRKWFMESSRHKKYVMSIIYGHF